MAPEPEPERGQAGHVGHVEVETIDVVVTNSDQTCSEGELKGCFEVGSEIFRRSLRAMG
jgi:hypothetical protein